MDRLLTQVRSRSLLFLSTIRSLSSFKSNSFDFKSRVLLNLINQSDASKSKSLISSSNTDLIYESNSLFPLPGHVGFPNRTNLLSKQLSNKIPTESSSTINQNLEIRTYDCSPSLRSELKDLFLNYNTLNQPLTAITLVFKTKSDMSKWSMEVENERHQLTEQFIKTAHEISKYLNKKKYWVDFIDPSNGKPHYGPSTSDALFETDERFQHFGINIVDLGCCRVIEHLQHGKIFKFIFCKKKQRNFLLGTHVFVGCIFTSAPNIDANIQQLVIESVAPNCSK